MECNVDKWKKKEILVKYKLSTIEEINKETKRYKKNEILLLYNDIMNIFNTKSPKYYFIIKLVPLDLHPKLRNIIIHQQRELKSFVKNIENINYNYEEIWCCMNTLDSSKNIYGRFSVNYGNQEIFQIIELVLGNTARELDRISDKNNIPFLSAKRLYWGLHYNIEKFIYNNDYEKMILLKYLKEASLKIEHLRNSFSDLLNSLTSIDIMGISFDFIVRPEKITFIDWDTSNDKLILWRLYE